MKQNIIIALLLAFVVLFGLPIASLAQSTLLPEKTNELPADNTSDSSMVQTGITASNTTQGLSTTADKDTMSWEYLIIALLAVSLLLLFLEIAVIPGFGICGISGILLLLSSLGLAYWKLSMTLAIVATVAAVVGVLILIAFMIWVFPKTKLGSKFVLTETAPVDENEDKNSLNRFLEAEGVATSYLRPSGIAKIAGERVDVITEGDYVEKGTKIKVVKITANRVIVAPVEE